MKTTIIKAFLFLLLLALPLALVSCGEKGEEEETETDLVYEIDDDEEGWSPIFTP